MKQIFQSDTLIGETIYLRQLHRNDAHAITIAANDWDVAKGTLTLPYPYTESDFLAFYDRVQARDDDHPQQTFCIVLRRSDKIIGACGIGIRDMHERAEIGYWVGKTYWGNGYATQATRCLINYGFTEHKLNRIAAEYFTDNPASRRVMEKAGMTFEGILRQKLIRENQHLQYREYKDVGVCAILRETWQATQ
mgnify:CR=1 FL=1